MDICFVFNFYSHKHPGRYSFFDIGKKQPYFDAKLSESTNLKNLTDYQLPLLEAILDISKKKDAKFSLFFSGVFLDILSHHRPKMLHPIRRFIDSGHLELLAGTYYNSLSCLYSNDAFKSDIKKHLRAVKSIFDYKPSCFTNSENIYSNEIAQQIKGMGFKSSIAPAIDWYLGGHNCHQVFQSEGAKKLSLLLADCSISKFLFDSSSSSTLFMDDSLKNKLVVVQADPMNMPKKMPWKKMLSSIKTRKNRFLSIEEAVKTHQSKTVYNIPSTVAHNCFGQDLSFFVENPIQKELFDKFKSLKGQLQPNNDLDDLLALSNTRNFLNLSTKTHSKQTEYPYNSYLEIMNMLTDIEIKLSPNSVKKGKKGFY